MPLYSTQDSRGCSRLDQHSPENDVSILLFHRCACCHGNTSWAEGQTAEWYAVLAVDDTRLIGTLRQSHVPAPAGSDRAGEQGMQARHTDPVLQGHMALLPPESGILGGSPQDVWALCCKLKSSDLILMSCKGVAMVTVHGSPWQVVMEPLG